MKIAAKYSHLNGYEYLLVHKKTLWNEIEWVVSAVDASQHRTKVSQEKAKKDTLLYSPIKLNATFNRLLRQKEWQ